MATRFRTPDQLLEQGDVDAPSYDAGDAPVYDGTEFNGLPVEVPVFHGGDANFPRPEGAAVVNWTGWIEPLNAADHDAYRKIPVQP